MWSPHVYGGLCDDSRYTGGDIGFALVGNPSSICAATKFSEREANVVCTSCEPNTPWITALIYRSKQRSDGYYLAFEDLPMSPTNWRAVTTSTSAPDGDFNDFVFHLTGVCHGDDECSAGGNGTGGGGGSSNGGSSNGGSSNGGDESGGSSNGGSSNGGSSNGGDANGGSGLSGGSDTGGNDTSGAAGLGEGGDGTSGSSPGTCVPGREVACTCSNGNEGSQRCLDDGRGYEACTCGDDDDDDTDSSGGCGCRYGTQGEAGFWAVGVLALVALRRRFRRGALR
jgi:MYXO-CTERM domain-containing protein